MQTELALLGELTNELKELDARLIAQCKTITQAYKICMSHSRVYMNQDDLAEAIGLKQAHFNRILNSDTAESPRHMPGTAEERLQMTCGNLAATQWRKMYRMGLLNCQRSKEDRRAELEAKLRALDSE